MPHRHLRICEFGHGVRVLSNWVLGFLAVSIWIMNYLVYFASDIRAWLRPRQTRAFAGSPMRTRADRRFTGPLPANERRPFPPPEPSPPPVHDAEIIPFPKRRRE
jgi:hypothetical protein